MPDLITIVLVFIAAGLGSWLAMYIKSHGGETAKIDARLDNLDKIVAELESVTATVETIKGEIGSERKIADRLWEEKYLTYIRAIDVLLKYAMAASALEVTMKAAKGDFAATDFGIRQAFVDASHELTSVRSALTLVSNLKVLSIVVPLMTPRFDPDDPQPDTSYIERCKEDAMRAINELTFAARADIHNPVERPAPPESDPEASSSSD